MTALAEACADLRPLLPVAAALVAEPDTTAPAGHAQPQSQPPWNTAAANALYDAHAAIRDLEQAFRQAVTGRPAHLARRQSWSDGNTLAALDALERLAPAVPELLVADAARLLTALADAVLMLPAVDLEERPRRLPGYCPACGRCMLSAWRRDGRVACLGCCLRGRMMPGTVSDGYIEWEDGEIT